MTGQDNTKESVVMDTTGKKKMRKVTCYLDAGYHHSNEWMKYRGEPVGR